MPKKKGKIARSIRGVKANPDFQDEVSNGVPVAETEASDLQQAVAMPHLATHETIRQLNHTYGNQAVQRLLTSKPQPTTPNTVQRVWPFTKKVQPQVQPPPINNQPQPPVNNGPAPIVIPPVALSEFLSVVDDVRDAHTTAKGAFPDDVLGGYGDTVTGTAFTQVIKPFLISQMSPDIQKEVRKSIGSKSAPDLQANFVSASQDAMDTTKQALDQQQNPAPDVKQRFKNAKAHHMIAKNPNDTRKEVASGLKDKVASAATEKALGLKSDDLMNQAPEAKEAVKNAALGAMRKLLSERGPALISPMENLLTTIEARRGMVEEGLQRDLNYAQHVRRYTATYTTMLTQTQQDWQTNKAVLDTDLQAAANVAALKSAQTQQKTVLTSVNKYLKKNKLQKQLLMGSATKEASDISQDVAQLKQMGDDTLKAKIEASDMSSALKKVAKLVDFELPQRGDKTKLDIYVEFAIPKFPVGFLGFHFLGEGENEDAENVDRFKKGEFNTKLKATIAVTGGGQLPGGLASAKLRGELGFYFEGQSKERGEGIMKLFSYATYRRWRESKYVPNELVDAIWGMGGEGLNATEKEGLRNKVALENKIAPGAVTPKQLNAEAAYQEAELWAQAIEAGWDSEEKIETGAMAAVNTELKVDTAYKQLGITGEARMNYGTKYDKKTIDANKARVLKLRQGKIDTRQAEIRELQVRVDRIVAVVTRLRRDPNADGRIIALREEIAKLQQKVDRDEEKKKVGDVRHNVGDFKRFFGRKGRQHAMGASVGVLQFKAAVSGVGPFGGDAKAKFKFEERNANDLQKDAQGRVKEGEYARNLLKGAEFEVNFNGMVDNQALFGDPQQVAVWAAGWLGGMAEKVEQMVQSTTGQVSGKGAKIKDNVDDFYQFGSPMASLVNAPEFGNNFAEAHSLYDPSKADVLSGVDHIKGAHDTISATSALNHIFLGKSGLRISFNIKKDKGKDGQFWIGIHRDSTKEISMPKGLDALANLKISHLNSKRLLKYAVLPKTHRGFSR